MSRRFTLLLFVAVLTGLSLPLGHTAEPAGKRYLIIHADDAGMSHSVNMATIEGMEKGCVTSASIMVPCPWFPEIAAYAKAHPEKDFGLHLTVNCEWHPYRWGPVASRDKVPTLLDQEGYLHHGTEAIAKGAKASEIEIELRAQIKKALDFGIPVTHLDTHMGALVTRPDILDVYVNLGIEFNLPVLFLRTVDEKLGKEYPALADKAGELSKALDAKGLPMLDALYQFYSGKSQEERRATYLKTLRELKPGINEIIIHCGVDNDELRTITSSSANRDGDRRIFTDPEVMAEIKKLGIELVGWKQCHEMTKAKPTGK